MTIQPDYVKEELLHELSESFCMHNQLPPDLFTRYRIKRGLRNADGTGVLVGASHLGTLSFAISHLFFISAQTSHFTLSS